MLRSRYRRIIMFFAGVMIHLAWWDIFLPRIGLRRLSHSTRNDRLRRIAANYRELAIQLGGVLIKVGQWLSSRLDVLPQAITDELSGLQDEVRPENFEDIRKVVETELGGPIESRFSEFEPEPVAAASIGQVHRARLLDLADNERSAELPDEVVVKVQRPDIELLVRTDLAALKVVSRWVEWYRPVRKRVNVQGLLNEFSRSLWEEVDYLHEGKNAETFAANFANDPQVRVPAVYWSHTTRHALTLEEIQGIKITDYATIEAYGIDRGEVANRLLDVYLKQIFDDHFFHADPHPGNLFVLPQDLDENGLATSWKLVFVDFGMAGEITADLVEGLRGALIAVANRDADQLIRAYQIMGMLLPTADLDLLRKANQAAFDRFWGKTTPEMMNISTREAAAFVGEFRGLLYDLPFQLPDNIILLGRCLSILNGICTGLDPNFNVWQSIVPYARKLVADQAGPMIEKALSSVGKFVQALISIPRRTEALLSKLEQGRLEVRMPELQSQMTRLERSTHRLGTAIFFAAFLFAAVQSFQMNQLWMAGGFGAVALILAVAGLLFQ